MFENSKRYKEVSEVSSLLIRIMSGKATPIKPTLVENYMRAVFNCDRKIEYNVYSTAGASFYIIVINDDNIDDISETNLKRIDIMAEYGSVYDPSSYKKIPVIFVTRSYIDYDMGVNHYEYTLSMLETISGNGIKRLECTNTIDHIEEKMVCMYYAMITDAAADNEAVTGGLFERELRNICSTQNVYELVYDLLLSMLEESDTLDLQMNNIDIQKLFYDCISKSEKEQMLILNQPITFK